MIKDKTVPNMFIRGAVELPPEIDATISRRERLLGPAYRLLYQKPLKFARGEGVWLYDEAGRSYLDAYNNVMSVGHCHPKVAEAVARQSRSLTVHMRYLHDSILDYAELLTSTMPDGLSQLMMTCSGSEANDLAYRIAADHTGGTGIIITDFAYHGITRAVSEFSASLGETVDLGSHVRQVPAPDLYRSASGDVGGDFETHVRAAIADLKRHGIKPAMLIVDTVFTSDGLLTEPKGFLKGAVAAIHEAGGLFVADEVQPGFGRTGEAMWGFQRHGVMPDIVTMGKPMGNGYPVAGLVARPEVVEAFGKKGRYFNTFAGNPVAAEAAKATLEVVLGEGLQQNALEVGGRMRAELERLAGKYPIIGDVRHAGLFAAVEIVKDRATKEPDGELAHLVVNGLREEGVLISASGKSGNIFKIRPPLVFSTANVDYFIERLDRVMAGLEQG